MIDRLNDGGRCRGMTRRERKTAPLLRACERCAVLGRGGNQAGKRNATRAPAARQREAAHDEVPSTLAAEECAAPYGQRDGPDTTKRRLEVVADEWLAAE